MPKHLMTGSGLTTNGTVGGALPFLDRVLCLGEAVHFDGTSTYTDRSVEARLEGGTAFTLLGSTAHAFFVGTTPALASSGSTLRRRLRARR
jgi:hypothetical protein